MTCQDFTSQLIFMHTVINTTVKNYNIELYAAALNMYEFGQHSITSLTAIMQSLQSRSLACSNAAAYISIYSWSRKIDKDRYTYRLSLLHKPSPIMRSNMQYYYCNSRCFQKRITIYNVSHLAHCMWGSNARECFKVIFQSDERALFS